MTTSFCFCSLLPPSHPGYIPLFLTDPLSTRKPFCFVLLPTDFNQGHLCGCESGRSSPTEAWRSIAPFANCLFSSTNQQSVAQEGAVEPWESLFQGVDDRPSLCWSGAVRSRLLGLCHDWRRTFSVSFFHFLALALRYFLILSIQGWPKYPASG